MTANRCCRIPPSERCPVCGHRGGWCLLSPDRTIAICPRTESPRRCGEAGWLHRLDTGAVGIAKAAPTPRRAARAQRAGDADLDPVYRAILARLRLTDNHRRQLHARGLTDSDIERATHRTLPPGCRASIGRQLRDLFGDDRLMAVPGIILRDGKHGRYMTLAGAPGILIPIRSAVGHVVGLVVRPDDQAEGGKYRWLSSAPAGPSPGWRVHVPAGTEPRPRIVLTEGALKADVAAALAPGRTIIGLPGCRIIPEAIEALHKLGARHPLLALDMDTIKNLQVAQGQLDGFRRLKEAGFSPEVFRWDADLGKGLDDLLLTLRRRRGS